MLLNKQRNLFKLFLDDVGLLAAMYGGNIQVRLLSNLNVNYGAAFENLVAQELFAHGFAIDHDLFYFNSKKQGELDFVVEYQGEVLPIEVKSGKDYERHRALSNIMDNEEYAVPQALVFCQENTQIKEQISEANTQIATISTERNQLKDKVNIAAQLDATGFWVTPKDKKSKEAKKVKEVKKFAFGFTIVKNVTAQNGQRIVYARILKPDNSVMGKKGTFPYENTTLEYTEKKYIDYTGEEEKVTMYSDVAEFLEAGTYKLFIFCDNQMIGQTTFTLK